MYLVTNALSEQLGSQYPFWQAPLPFDLISADMSGRISAQGTHHQLMTDNPLYQQLVAALSLDK